jgi:transposase
MAIVDHKNANGTIYVYEQRSVWDKEKKRSRNRQVCIGKRDTDTGEIIYNRRFSDERAAGAVADGAAFVSSVVIGSTLVLDEAAKRSGVSAVLSEVFEDDFVDRVISIAYAIVCDSGKMYHAAAWMEGHMCPCHDNPLTSSDISRMLSSITPSVVETFLRVWAERKADRRGYYCFDVTSISSYAKSLSGVEWGYNRDKEKLPQINIALLSGIASRLPVFYEQLAGSLPDVRAIHKLEERLKKLGLQKIVLLLDRGFLSEANMMEMMGHKTKFMMPLRSELVLSQALIDEHRETIEDMDNIIEVDDAYTAAIYATSVVSKLAGKRIWYHIYFDTLAFKESLLRLFEKIAVCEAELKSGNLEATHAELYEKYFIVKETPKRGRTVKRNQKEINRYKTSYTGYWVIATNAEKDAGSALRAYRKRNDVECQFKDLKDELDLTRLRMHSDATVTGRLFVQFIALILLEQIREIMSASTLPKSLSVSEMFRRLGTYHRIDFSGKYRAIVSTPTKIQRKVFDAFEIPYSER